MGSNVSKKIKSPELTLTNGDYIYGGKNGMPGKLNFELSAGKLNPFVIIKGWGNAKIKEAKINNKPLKNYLIGYEKHLKFTNLVLWIKRENS